MIEHARFCCCCGMLIPSEKLRRGTRGAFFCSVECRTADRQAFRKARASARTLQGKCPACGRVRRAKASVLACNAQETVAQEVVP